MPALAWVGGLRRPESQAGALLPIVLVAACESPMAPSPCGPIPQVTVHAGEASSVPACFNDPNGDALNYGVGSSNASVAVATIGGGIVTVTARAPGSATITVTAVDSDALQAQQSFRVEVPNRPPQARGSIPAQRVEAGREVVVDLASWFEEPDGESLAFRVVPSDATIAGVALSGSRATLAALAKGVADITVAATDPGGLAAVQVFPFEVPNRGPFAVGVVEGQVMERGETRTIDLAPLFDDPDRDPLRHVTSSSNPRAVTATVSGAALQLTAIAAGRATVTVTARDPDGLTATQSFSAEAPNRPPAAVGALPDQELAAGETVQLEVQAHFTDPDGDALAYTATSSNSSVARASVSGSTVTITAASAGNATITVTARDPGGLVASHHFRVTVHLPNRPPRPVGSIPAQTIEAGDGARVNVSAYFIDPDGHPLTYSASSSDAEVASAEIFGETLEFYGVRKGRATITVTASDPGGLTTIQSFPVTVTGEDRGSFQIDLRFATAMTTAQEAAFQKASVRWMALLGDTELPDIPVPEGVVRCRFPEQGYETRVGVVDDLLIIAAVAEIDGNGGTLGRAGPCGVREASRLPWFGAMEFDAADLAGMEADGTLESVILHEMGHVLGIGSLWDDHGLLRNPSLAAEREVDTHFAGAKAIRAFDEVGGASYTAGAKVPVENQGTRPGSDDSHWRKNVFGNELMNPSVEPVMPLSAVTAASLADLGYAVRMDLADAYRLPGAAALRAHQRRAIDLGNDVIRLPIEMRDEKGRVVGIRLP